MAERSVLVRLRASVDQFRADLKQAERSVRDVGDTSERTGKRVSDGFDAAGRGASRLGSLTATAALGFGGLTVAAGAAASKIIDFEKAMSGVQAATGATAGTMAELRGAIMQAGADSQYSATEAANAVTELSKAGIGAADILSGGLAGALDLAAAGQLGVAEAAEIGATAMQVFGLEGDQMSHVADLLAAGAGKAQGSVNDLGMALNQSALVADQTGLSIEDTAGALALFASNGLIGSDAGTSFKTMLAALTPNSAAAAEAMADLGISAYDSQGQFIGLEQYAGQLKGALSGLTEEQRNATLETIFGSDAVRAAAILYEAGAEGVQQWTDKVNDAGFASEQAAALTDNLAGDLERLSGSWDTLLITLGGEGQGVLREGVQLLNGVVDGVTWAVDAFKSLPGPVQATVVALGGMAALRGPLSGVMDTIRSLSETAALRMMYMADSMTSVSGAAGLARGGMSSFVGFLGGPWGAALTGAVVGTTALAEWLGNATQATEETKRAQRDLASALELSNGAIDENVRLSAAKAAQDADLFDMAGDLGIGLDTITEAVLGNSAAYDEVTAALARYREQEALLGGGNESERFGRAIEATNTFRNQLDELVPTVARTREQQTQLAEATGQTATALAGIPAVAGATFDSLANYAAHLGMDEKATEELIKDTEQLGESLVGFVDPLAVYTGYLDAKIAKEQEAAGQTDATGQAGQEAWRQFVDGAGISMDQYLTDLEEQLVAQENWQVNMLRLAGRVSQGTLDELARMGPEGAPLVADLVNASDAELARFDDITYARSKEATDAWGQQLRLAQPVLAQIGRTAGQGVVDELAAKLRAGTITVADIARQYGVNLAGGINPVLGALGRREIHLATGRGFQAADGAIFDFYAGGGFAENHVAQIARAGDWRVWAEPETPGEALIPLAHHRPMATDTRQETAA